MQNAVHTTNTKYGPYSKNNLQGLIIVEKILLNLFYIFLYIHFI